MEGYVVSGVTHTKKETKITILGVPDKPGVAAQIFSRIAEETINIDDIVQNISEEGTTNISFTIGTGELNKTKAVMTALVQEIGAELSIDEHVGKVSVVGVGMKSHTGVARDMFRALADKKINIQMISTSEIKISCILAEQDVEEAVRAIHEKFKLNMRNEP